MKFAYLIFFFQIYNILCNDLLNTSFINNGNNSIDNAIYIIKTRDEDLNLELSNFDYLTMKSESKNRKANFYIKKEQDENANISYFSIEYKPLEKYISIENKDIAKLKVDSFDDKLSLWNIIPKINSDYQLVYYVQNKFNQKFWEFNSTSETNNLILSSNTNINNLNINNEFQFIRLYKESDKHVSKILKDEPIDVLITYVDLSDPNYVSKVPRIKKDHDNKELKYSLRSILKNIPWVRKIFILMPNEKVSFLKPIEEINEKIVYVKDSDYLGFDSASSPTLQFNLFKMRKFNLSENFILMDDDNFIAEPLEKSDFFYEENGKVYPCLITSEFNEMNKQNLENNLSKYLSKYDGKIAHSTSNFLVQQSRSLLLMYDIFGDDNQRNGKKLIEPTFTHNATPLKLSDIEEIYGYVIKYYNFAKETLEALSRSVNSLQMQTTYTAYVKNKYDRKVSCVSSAFYDITQFNMVYRNKKKLFVINTGLRNYPSSIFTRETQLMKDLFPKKTKYELEDDNSNSIFNFFKSKKNKNIIIKNYNYTNNSTSTKSSSYSNKTKKFFLIIFLLIFIVIGFLYRKEFSIKTKIYKFLNYLGSIILFRRPAFRGYRNIKKKNNKKHNNIIYKRRNI